MSTRFTGRRFSWARFTALALSTALVGYGVWAGLGWWHDSAQAASERSPWFAGYVDVTASPSYPFEAPTAEASQNVVLAFVVAAADHTCTPSWGASYSLDQAATDLDLDRRIARVREQGRSLAVSFGGQQNQELGSACTSAADLARAYGSVIDRYHVDTLDLDLEGPALTDPAAARRRAAAIAQLQQEARAAGRQLTVWLTLPAITTGLTQQGTDLVAGFLADGVDLAGVNVMTMNFGDTRDDGQSMAEAARESLTNTQRQLGILYRAAGTDLGPQALWRKVGATPMIGQNDQPDQVFTLQDATDLNTFAHTTGLGRVSMWSLNRDQPCSANYPDIHKVSDSCSGIAQGTDRFAARLGDGLNGSPAQVTPEPSPVSPTSSPADDPSTSPYPVWRETSSYPAGTKIVWHGNVYEAKWWTQGNLPDDPVLQESQTPWRLIGPVLPGEKPVPVPSLPAGFYPTWKPGVNYTAGQRVIFQGMAFEARWWNTATSPESSLVDPGGSPWRALSQQEIRAILAK